MCGVAVRAACVLIAVWAMQQAALAEDALQSGLPPIAAGTAGASPTQIAQAPGSAPAPASCDGVNPYDNFACLDAYLGDDVFGRLVNYYKLEWGRAVSPPDPNAPPTHIDGWPRTPETTPPEPFTEWPYGGTTSLGVTPTASVDSPLMVAIANTGVGQWLNTTGIQVYGWVDPGFNVSNESVKPNGNSPIAYNYTPNTLELDQFVLYVDRYPDTVQTDHVDWGMRMSLLYGENYRYTTAYGITSYQFLKNNQVNGYDFPMMYFDLYFPQVMKGLMVRVGRYISLPDIEAQLAPNNYMYTHSLTYAYDNYTNEGIQTTLAVTNDLFIQLGLSDGTEAAIWHLGQHIANPDPNPLYPGTTMLKDPGAQPTFTGCFRYNWNDGWDNINGCANGINSGAWGYNNLQWYGFTAYHKWNDNWHIAFEMYDEHQDHVLNADNPTAAAILAAGGTPFSPQYMPFNAANPAHCGGNAGLSCYAHATGVTSYINYSPDPLDNFSLRPEFYGDWQGQRTGTKAVYYGLGLGWQHWLSPQIELRPEVDYYRSNGANAFNGNANAGIAPTRNFVVLGAMDMILHF